MSPPRAPTAVTPRLEVGRVTRRGFCTVQCNRLRETACQNQSLKQLWNVQHYIILTKWQTSMKEQKTTCLDCLVDTKEQEVLLRISNFFPILISKESEASKSSANCHLFLEFLEICTLLPCNFSGSYLIPINCRGIYSVWGPVSKNDWACL